MRAIFGRGGWAVPVLIVCGLLGPLPSARAHEAASGWTYPSHCCSDFDCYEIDAKELEPVKGGWRIRASGEFWSTNRVNRSPDGRYHRCSAQGRREGRTICLWVPAGT